LQIITERWSRCADVAVSWIKEAGTGLTRATLL
jgi:hypothetical protein